MTRSVSAAPPAFPDPPPEALLAFYDFPAEHWKHLRTTNPIESKFATVGHRTMRYKGCLSNRTAIAMVVKLAQAAEKSWRRLVSRPVPVLQGRWCAIRIDPPKKYQSGEADVTGRISKIGDGSVRMPSTRQPTSF
jgi:hypothetical protein